MSNKDITILVIIAFLLEVLMLSCAFNKCLFAYPFCDTVDCYEIEEQSITSHVNKCIYQSNVIMLLVQWKKDNKFEQIKYNNTGKKYIDCIDNMPNKINYDAVTNEQLNFIEQLRCSYQNLTIDPVHYSINYYAKCMEQFRVK